MNCARPVAAHCNGKDVRAVVLKRNVEGGQVFDGPLVDICAGCRRALQGQFKYAKLTVPLVASPDACRY